MSTPRTNVKYPRAIGQVHCASVQPRPEGQNDASDSSLPTEASPQTRAICAEYLPAIEAMAVAAGTSRAVVIRSMIADWFRSNPAAARRFGVEIESVEAHLAREGGAR